MRTARRQLQAAPEGKALRYYGSGESGWGAQTTQKALLAFAVLATDEEYDPAIAGASRDELLSEALALLRYLLATHVTGPLACVDLAKWGHTWISVLGMERAYPALRLLEPYLPASERERLAELQLSEARWILEHYPVNGGLRQNNRPESNLWNAAFLWRLLHRTPGALDAARVKEKVAALVRHGFSTPSSLSSSDTAFAALESPGIGPNFYDSYALHHHRYLNIGYIAICLSQIALLHYDCRELQSPEPPGWHQHGREVWELLRLLTFPDGRLVRVGGDTRVRYAYCQDYHFLCWHYAHDVLHCPSATGYYHGWINLLEREEQVNRSDAFFSERCAALRTAAPGYYYRLEADRAVALGLNRYWQREGLSSLGAPLPPAPQSITLERWHDAAHGAYVWRTARGILSWVWDAAEPPQGLFAPIHRSDLAEWRANLGGEVTGMGRRNFQEIEVFHGVEWSGGFVTAGSTVHVSDGWITEGQLAAQLARQRTACVVWGEEMYVFQSCTALRRAEVQTIKGVHLQIPNDLFNGGARCYTADGEGFISRFGQPTPETYAFGASRLEIDGALHLDLLTGGEGWSLYRPPERNVRLKLYRERDMAANPGSLLSEQVCCPLEITPRTIEKGERLYEVVCRLSFTGEGETEAVAPERLPEGVHSILRYENGRLLFGIWFNAGEAPVELAPEFSAKPAVLSRAEWHSGERLQLEPLGVAVLTAD